MDPGVFLEPFIHWPVGLYPGTLELIDSIPRRYRRAVLSNSNALHWPRLMHDRRLADVFDHHFFSHLIGKIKPDAEAFHHVLNALDCRADEVLFLDDNALNINAARNLGIRAVQVQGVVEARRALQSTGIIDEFDDGGESTG